MDIKKRDKCIRQAIANIQKELNALYLLLEEDNDVVTNIQSTNDTTATSEIDSNKHLNDTELTLAVTNILQELRIPAHIKGYEYARESIIICYKDENTSDNFQKNLYPKIAVMYNTTKDAVERGIRNAIEISSESITPESMKKYFGYVYTPRKGRPSNAQFLAALTDYIKLHM